MNLHKHRLASLATLLCLGLAACGGNGSSSNDDVDDGDSGETPVSDPVFSETAVSWVAPVPGDGDAICFDIDAGEETSCDDSSTWDLKFDSDMKLWTNGGVSGSGAGAALGLLSWTDLLSWTSATVDPSSGTDVSSVYIEDSAGGVFTDSLWYAYDLEGTHLLYPNDRVYLISDNPSDDTAAEYALQVIGYYGGDGGTTSGYPRLRWINRSAPDTVNTQTYDATDSDAWVYISLATGEVLDLDDTTAQDSTAWDIAVRRYEVKLNGGASGPGSVAGYLGYTPEGLYDDDGTAVTDAFLALDPDDTLAYLSTEAMSEPASSRSWISDSTSSVLNPDYTGSYPGTLDYGWFLYDPTTHFISADTDAAALLRSGSGASYARFHLTSIDYADTTNPSSQVTWTFEFNVQAETD